jgi:hypothetical protein
MSIEDQLETAIHKIIAGGRPIDAAGILRQLADHHPELLQASTDHLLRLGIHAAIEQYNRPGRKGVRV